LIAARNILTEYITTASKTPTFVLVLYNSPRHEDSNSGMCPCADYGYAIHGRMPRLEDAGDICLSKPRPNQGCRADDAAAAADDDDGIIYSI